MKRILLWWGKLTKRLYKKPTFLLILVLIPILTFGYGVAAQEDSGMLTVVLAREDDDPMAVAVMEELSQSSELILFKTASAEDAQAQVEAGKADAAWIFTKNMQQKVYEFIAKRSLWNSFVRVIERESNVPVILAREKLSGAVFESCSRAMYLQYLRENVPELDSTSDETLFGYYDAMAVEGNLFEFATVDGSQPAQKAEDASYLMTPVRGLLAVVAVLCGLATAMYYTADRTRGTFAWISENKLFFVELGCQMVSLLNVCAVTLLSLWAVGQTVGIIRELLQMLLYAMSVALFAMLMRKVFGGLRGLAVALPLLVVVMLVVCPVFFDLGALRELQYLFPPTYYIHASYSARYFGLMGVYALVLLGLNFLLGLIPGRK